MGTNSAIVKAAASRFALKLAERGQNGKMAMCLINTGKEEKCLILPGDVCQHLVQEDQEYWQAGDFSLLEILYPEWYEEILHGLGLKS